MRSRYNPALQRIATCGTQLGHGACERRAMHVLPEKRLRCRQAQLPGVDMNGNVVEACIATAAPDLFRIMEREHLAHEPRRLRADVARDRFPHYPEDYPHWPPHRDDPAPTPPQHPTHLAPPRPP